VSAIVVVLRLFCLFELLTFGEGDMNKSSNDGNIASAKKIELEMDGGGNGLVFIGAGGAIPNDPFVIDSRSPNSGDIISSSSPFSPSVDGFFLLDTDNDGNASGGGNFSFVFKVMVSNPGATGISATFFSQATGNQGPTVGATAFMNVPIRRGSKVTVSYYGGGANNLAKSIYVRMWFYAMSASTN
jgi:hypothetical protein